MMTRPKVPPNGSCGPNTDRDVRDHVVMASSFTTVS